MELLAPPPELTCRTDSRASATQKNARECGVRVSRSKGTGQMIKSKYRHGLDLPEMACRRHLVQWTALGPIARRTDSYSRHLDQERMDPSTGHMAKCPGQVNMQLER